MCKKVCLGSSFQNYSFLVLPVCSYRLFISCFIKVVRDIDTLFLRDIEEGFNLASEYDFCLLYRPKFMPVKGKITISTIFIRASNKTSNFLYTWLYNINKISPAQRPVGYGQTSFYNTFEHLKDDVSVHTLDHRWGYPGSKSNTPDNFVWSGAIHKMRKTDCVNHFRKKMKEVEA